MNTEGHPEATKRQASAPNPWRQAVDDALVSAGLDCLAPDADPTAAVTSLVENEVAMALDPAISERAQALIERGQASAPPAAQQPLANGIQPGETVAQAAERWAQWCERRCLSMLPEFLRLLARAWESAVAAQQPAVEPLTIEMIDAYANARELHKKWFDSPSTAAAYREAREQICAALQSGAWTPATQPAAPDVVADARRYRLLRRGQHFGVVDGAGDELHAEALDAAIDAELDREGPKT